MSPMEYIRRAVFRASQAELARIAGVTQATVSRWESRQFDPNLGELIRIRRAACARGIAWEDRWFFDTPPPESAVPPRAAGC